MAGIQIRPLFGPAVFQLDDLEDESKLIEQTILVIRHSVTSVKGGESRINRDFLIELIQKVSVKVFQKLQNFVVISLVSFVFCRTNIKKNLKESLLNLLKWNIRKQT